MNKEIKRLWLENLSNGKYKEMKQEYFPKNIQSDFTLRWKNYCNPFGVLCDLYAKFWGVKDGWQNNFNKENPDWKSVEFQRGEWWIPKSVYMWAWLEITPYAEERELWNMSFKEASEYIEKNL